MPQIVHHNRPAQGFLPSLSARTPGDADDRVLKPLTGAGKSAVIPPRQNRTAPRQFDQALYQSRHLIENFFCKLKQFRGLATRYDKTARNFLAALHLAAATIWLI